MPVCMSVCLSVPLFSFKVLLLPFPNRKSNPLIAKRFLRRKLRKDIGIRYCNFGSDMVKNYLTKKRKNCVDHCQSILKDLGHNQPLPYRSPFASFPLTFRFLLTLFVDTCCGPVLLKLVVDFLSSSFATPFQFFLLLQKRKEICAFCPFLRDPEQTNHTQIE